MALGKIRLPRFFGGGDLSIPSNKLKPASLVSTARMNGTIVGFSAIGQRFETTHATDNQIKDIFPEYVELIKQSQDPSLTTTERMNASAASGIFSNASYTGFKKAHFGASAMFLEAKPEDYERFSLIQRIIDGPLTDSPRLNPYPKTVLKGLSQEQVEEIFSAYDLACDAFVYPHDEKAVPQDEPHAARFKIPVDILKSIAEENKSEPAQLWTSEAAL